MPDTPEITWRGCEDIIPKKESDCILSQADKDHNFAYCCFESLAGLINICTLKLKNLLKMRWKLVSSLDIKMKLFLYAMIKLIKVYS